MRPGGSSPCGPWPSSGSLVRPAAPSRHLCGERLALRSAPFRVPRPAFRQREVTGSRGTPATEVDYWPIYAAAISM